MSRPRPGSLGLAALLAAAIPLQVALLLWVDGATADGTAPAWIAPGALVLAAAVFVRARARWHGGIVDACTVTLSLGGLAMVAGGLLDGPVLGAQAARSTDAGHAHVGHAHVAHAHAGLSHLLSWATVSMLAICVPACRLLCPGGRARTACHALGALGMLAGMAVFGHLLGPTLGSWLGASALGDHIAMLAGMTAGTGLGLAVARHSVEKLTADRLGAADSAIGR